jgi:NADH:ubiquinone reductase (H+-translocating)
MKTREVITADLPERIVIVGGGFAGVTLVQRLECALPVQTEIIVLSAENHLVFTPMLPEVVGRTISPLHVVVAV